AGGPGGQGGSARSAVGEDAGADRTHAAGTVGSIAAGDDRGAEQSHRYRGGCSDGGWPRARRCVRDRMAAESGRRSGRPLPWRLHLLQEHRVLELPRRGGRRPVNGGVYSFQDSVETAEGAGGGGHRRTYRGRGRGVRALLAVFAEEDRSCI